MYEQCYTLLFYLYYIKNNKDRFGIILEIKIDHRVPDAAVVLWANGTIRGKWCDDLIISNEK